MDDPELMGVMHRFADASHQLQALPRIETLRFRVTVERLAANELHGEVGLRAKIGVHGAGLIDLRDTGVLQAAQRLRFLSKTARQLLACQAWIDHLEGYDPPGAVLL